MNLFNILQNLSSSVSSLELQNISLHSLLNNSFLAMNNPANVKSLNLSTNFLVGYLPIDTLKPLSLKHLDLSKNQLTENNSLGDNITTLQTLNLRSNVFNWITYIFFCSFPNAIEIDLSVNCIQFMSTEKGEHCLTQLRILHLKESNVHVMLHLELFKSLEKLILDFGSTVKTLPESLKQVSTLNKLELYVPGLETLDSNTFKNLSDLKKLTIVKNSIHNFDSSLFKPLGKLTHLNIANTQVTHFNITMLHYLTSLNVISIYNNQLMCSCELQKFLNYIRYHGIFLAELFKSNKLSCEIVNGQTTPLLKFHENQFYCTHSYDVMVISVIFCVLCLCIMLLSLCYRCRWYLRYEFFLMRTKVYRYRETTKNKSNYVFDAFVSFSEKDCEWVMKNLVREIEVFNNFKLCLYNRNWLGGASILESIVQSIESSRRVFFVVTKHWLNSNYCKDELNLARYVNITNH